MRRRSVLRTSGAAMVALFAGCTSTPSADDDDGNYTRIRDREGELDEDDIVIDSTGIDEPGADEDRPPVFHGFVTNEGDVLAENVELTIEFYDGGGSVVFDHTIAIGNLGPGSIERVHLPFPSDVSADDVEDYDISWSETDEDDENASDH